MEFKAVMKHNSIVFNNKKDFADFFDVSENTIEMWLQGRCKPRKKLGIHQVFVDSLLILDFTGRK